MGAEGRLTEAKLARLRYLKACQTESQRLEPVALGTSRRLKTEMVLSAP